MPDNDRMTAREWGHVTTKRALAGLEEALRRVQGDLRAVLSVVDGKVEDAGERLIEIGGSVVVIGLDQELEEALGEWRKFRDDIHRILLDVEIRLRRLEKAAENVGLDISPAYVHEDADND